MLARPAHLPDFHKPPLNEVALGIQFGEIKGLGAIHMGLFWERIRDRFPTWSEQPVLPVLFELFGGAEQKVAAPAIEMFTTAPMNRFWFIEKDEAELIQLQNNRFHWNWRNLKLAGKSGKYPHYEAIRESFREGVDNLSAFLSAQKLSPIESNQCEVTYVNHFDLQDGEDFAEAMPRIFGDWQTLSAEVGANLENLNTDLRFKLYGSDKSSPIGRLHISIKPAYRNDGRPIVMMQLIGRGRPIKPSIDGCLEFMDIARDAIVVKFTQLTSDAMHKQWERFK